MNQVVLCGRLTKDPAIQKYNNDEKETLIARYTLAVPRTYTSDGKENVDFIRCVAFGRRAEFAQKYLHKGVKMAVVGRIQTGSYDASDGSKRYTTDIYISEQEFAESKKKEALEEDKEGYANILNSIDEELPFQ